MRLPEDSCLVLLKWHFVVLTIFISIGGFIGEHSQKQTTYPFSLTSYSSLHNYFMSLPSSVSITLFFDIKGITSSVITGENVTVGVQILGGSISSGCTRYVKKSMKDSILSTFLCYAHVYLYNWHTSETWRELPSHYCRLSNRYHQHVLCQVYRVDGIYARGHRSLTCLGCLWDSRHHLRQTDQKARGNQSTPIDLQLGSPALHLDNPQLRCERPDLGCRTLLTRLCWLKSHL